MGHGKMATNSSIIRMERPKPNKFFFIIFYFAIKWFAKSSRVFLQMFMRRHHFTFISQRSYVRNKCCI